MGPHNTRNAGPRSRQAPQAVVLRRAPRSRPRRDAQQPLPTVAPHRLHRQPDPASRHHLRAANARAAMAVAKTPPAVDRTAARAELATKNTTPRSKKGVRSTKPGCRRPFTRTCRGPRTHDGEGTLTDGHN